MSIYIAQLNMMSHCAPEATLKPIRFKFTPETFVSAKLHYTDTGYGHVVQHHQRTSSQQVVDVAQHVRRRLNLLYNIFPGYEHVVI